MIDFDKELQDILKNDPLGLLDVKPKASSVISNDARLVASFEEINDFLKMHGREPVKGQDINERKLYSRLKGLRENPEKAAALIEYDTFNLFADLKNTEPKEINTIEDVLKDDVLGLLGDEATEPIDIFTLKNIPM